MQAIPGYLSATLIHIPFRFIARVYYTQPLSFLSSQTRPGIDKGRGNRPKSGWNGKDATTFYCLANGPDPESHICTEILMEEKGDF